MRGPPTAGRRASRAAEAHLRAVVQREPQRRAEELERTSPGPARVDLATRGGGASARARIDAASFCRRADGAGRACTRAGRGAAASRAATRFVDAGPRPCPDRRSPPVSASWSGGRRISSVRPRAVSPTTPGRWSRQSRRQQAATVRCARSSSARPRRRSVRRGRPRGPRSERRRALQEVADRLRRRERDLRERIDHEETEAVQRIQVRFEDVERRQVEQLQRAVEREGRGTQRPPARSSTMRSSAPARRPHAGSRGSSIGAWRNLRAKPKVVLAESLARATETGAQRVEKRLAEHVATLQRQSEELAAGARAARGRGRERASAPPRRRRRRPRIRADRARGQAPGPLHSASTQALAHSRR